ASGPGESLRAGSGAFRRPRPGAGDRPAPRPDPVLVVCGSGHTAARARPRFV
ncbi:MAG: hypothetical protein AVDCRST_MAG45-1575, partial [uncultured Solirubrobacterales bacterium]